MEYSGKGMSQTLTLIVAASVLMMTALTVIFMVNQGLTSTKEGLDRSKCRQAVESRCQLASQGQSPGVPASCIYQGQNGPQVATGLDSRLPASVNGNLNC